MKPKVFVVILNFNRADDTVECVSSVRRSDYPNYEIVLVDNDSAEASYLSLKSQFPDILLIRNEDNLGYAEGNNVGIRYALSHGCDYVFVLNNDTVIDPGALSRLVETGEVDPRRTILAPKVRFYGERDRINSLGTSMDWFRLKPRLASYGRRDHGGTPKIEEKQIVPGCALMLKRSLLKSVGMFNPDLYLIHEDADLCLRNLKFGNKNVLDTGAVIYHKVSRTLSEYPYLTSYYSIRNMLYLIKNHAPVLNRLKSYLGLVFLILKNSMLHWLQPSRRDHTHGFFRGVQDFFRNRMGRCQKES